MPRILWQRRGWTGRHGTILCICVWYSLNSAELVPVWVLSRNQGTTGYLDWWSRLWYLNYRVCRRAITMHNQVGSLYTVIVGARLGAWWGVEYVLHIPYGQGGGVSGGGWARLVVDDRPWREHVLQDIMSFTENPSVTLNWQWTKVLLTSIVQDKVLFTQYRWYRQEGVMESSVAFLGIIWLGWCFIGDKTRCTSMKSWCPILSTLIQTNYGYTIFFIARSLWNTFWYLGVYDKFKERHELVRGGREKKRKPLYSKYRPIATQPT